MVSDGIEDDTLGKELGVDVSVVEELSEPEFALVECRHFRLIVAQDPQFADGCC
jgi:hypothetical protein